MFTDFKSAKGRPKNCIFPGLGRKTSVLVWLNCVRLVLCNAGAVDKIHVGGLKFLADYCGMILTLLRKRISNFFFNHEKL